ncbi:hypothetical protein ElyMa_000106700 [Elysia marginata]|uniref:Uncharacterized protein n=1 Tax=Elysia marginata TaxID=1093978 RepID=A0AAV4ELD4_9GAST|nr:hypothetical protein ElyMa_000106700 [Elysia marginata]
MLALGSTYRRAARQASHAPVGLPDTVGPTQQDLIDLLYTGLSVGYSSLARKLNELDMDKLHRNPVRSYIRPSLAVIAGIRASLAITADFNLR